MRGLVRTGLLLFFMIIITGNKTRDVDNEVRSLRTPLALELGEVIDGRTFIAGSQKVRIWGILAPVPGDPNSFASKLLLKTLLNRAPHSCYFKSKEEQTYYVMKCFSEGEDIGAMMVNMGMARDDIETSGGAYFMEERAARENKYGIWK